MTRQETIEKATNWMESTTKDHKHGYCSQKWLEKALAYESLLQ